VATGPSGAGAARDKGEAEQVLLDKALKDYLLPVHALAAVGHGPELSRRDPHQGHARDRHPRADPGQGRHHAAPDRDFLPDGSYLAEISGGGATLAVRVIEYTVTVAGRDALELFLPHH